MKRKGYCGICWWYVEFDHKRMIGGCWNSAITAPVVTAEFECPYFIDKNNEDEIERLKKCLTIKA